LRAWNQNSTTGPTKNHQNQALFEKVGQSNEQNKESPKGVGGGNPAWKSELYHQSPYSNSSKQKLKNWKGRSKLTLKQKASPTSPLPRILKYQV